MRLLIVFVIALSTIVVHAQRPLDLAVVNVLMQYGPSAARARVWRRIPVDEQLDLVLAVGMPENASDQPLRNWFWWSGSVLGLYLQDRARPDRVFSLTTGAGPLDCTARIIRATATDTVISCDGEKFEVHPREKFVYDIRAKRLVGQVSYYPYIVVGPHRKRGDSIIFTAETNSGYSGRTNDRERVEVEYSPEEGPRIRGRVANVTRTEPAPKPMPRFGPGGAFTLEQLPETPDGLCAGGDVLIVNRSSGRRYSVPGKDCGAIGPWHVEGGRFWFGRTFYAGEGYSGTGGFGYFDVATRRFETFSSREFTTPAASAIHVQPDAVWVALVTHGEYGHYGEGVIRYDRQLRTYQRFDIGAEVGNKFIELGERLLLTTDHNLLIFHNGEVTGYTVDKTTDGRLRMAAVDLPPAS